VKNRVIFGLTAAIVLVLALYLAPLWFLSGMACAAAVVGYLEFDQLFFSSPRANGTFRRGTQLVLLVFTVAAMSHSVQAGWLAFWVSPVVLSIFHVVHSNKGEDFSREVRDASLEMLGFWYLVSLFGFLVPIAKLDGGRNLLLFLFIVVFLGDTVAFLVGRKWGKHSLASLVSPKKTVEGAAGGIAGSIVGALGWLLLFRGDAAWGGRTFWILVLAAPVLGALGQFGDLFESLLKRSRQQKDSGAFLPGHGGMLDRVDGLALSAPLFYFYLVLVSGGGF
jgi:phosphatidate cytidylyltransferase